MNKLSVLILLALVGPNIAAPPASDEAVEAVSPVFPDKVDFEWEKNLDDKMKSLNFEAMDPSESMKAVYDMATSLRIDPMEQVNGLSELMTSLSKSASSVAGQMGEVAVQARDVMGRMTGPALAFGLVFVVIYLIYYVATTAFNLKYSVLAGLSRALNSGVAPYITNFTFNKDDTDSLVATDRSFSDLAEFVMNAVDKYSNLE